jgi:tRNA(Arg) A34 adenosine deaminase TadA
MSDHLDPGDETFLLAAIDLAARAREHGNHPFGALLTLNGQAVKEAENTVVTGRDVTGHAETNLVRLASHAYDRERLIQATLYTSTEPCVMCAGAIFWSGIGRIVYGLGADALRAMTGDDPGEPSMALRCREVFAASRRPTEISGPHLYEQAAAVHDGFWTAQPTPTAT